MRKRLERKEKTYETSQLMKEKRSEEYEVLEEVFDKPTLMTIYEMMNHGIIGEIYGVVKAGKESRLYWGKSPEGEELAIKIYLTVSGEFRKGMLPYILGDPRFKNVKRDPRSLVYAWAKKEFKNLTDAYDAGVNVPKPFTVQNNVLVMEFIGENGVPAPLLKESKLKNPQVFYKKVLSQVRKLYLDAKLVHGDLSEYNIMVYGGKPVLFDISQAVNLEHPGAEQFLIRDVENLNRYFESIGVDVLSLEEALRRIKGGSALRKDTA
ncbi:MAG: serine protein kinase RIO [Candidatus Bathyarchaeota archaeon]|nr:serine protein kinase RIO [Candidatus Bathyarchaeota archaeon]